MLAIVRIALRRPYTFVVLALLILIMGPLAALRTPVDIFPEIRIPVIAVVWQYTGLAPQDMTGRVLSPYERSLTTTVNDIEHIEATGYNGVGLVKIFFQPDVDIRTANAQVTAASQTVLKSLPPNTTPPLILNYNASTVPIIQLALSGNGLSEQQLGDIGQNVIRISLITVPGAAVPSPYGGKTREVQIDLNAAAMQARGLSAQDVAHALAAQNLLTPVGTEKIGHFEYTIELNDAPTVIRELGNLPIKAVGGAMVYIHDVAQVRDGNPPQTNVVHVDGNRSVLMQVLKNGAVSTLSIIDGVKQTVQRIKGILPPDLKIALLSDQSVFIKAAIGGVIREGVIAAALTSLMILLFLGSVRSTIIIATSIPLSVLGSIATLWALGETLNVMTLGGLALAVGVLVDEATVTIENINWHLEQGKEVETAIMDGAAQIVVPAFVSLLCICIVFVPMYLLTGISRYLFVPMAEALMAAMLWSFILSTTLVPTMAKFLLRKHAPHTDMHGLDGPLPPSRNPFVRLQRGFEAQFERFRDRYRDLLAMALRNRARFVIGFLTFVFASFALTPYIGQDFFPAVDSGQILLHVRTLVGTRIEDSAAQFTDIEDAIRQIVPPKDLDTIVDNIGFPVSGINSAYNNDGTIGPQDGDIQIKLSEDHRPTAQYIQIMREELPERFPGVTFSFLPADIISQILNFGAPAPIDLQIRGPDIDSDSAYAEKLLRQIRDDPGLVDARIQQSLDGPAFDVDVDRTRAQYVGITEGDVANSLVVNLAGSSQVTPTFWLNPKNGISYSIVMQTPQYQLDSLSALRSLQITAPGVQPQTLGAIAGIHRANLPAVYSQYDVEPMIDIYGTTQGRDLGGVAADIQKIVDQDTNNRPPGVQVVMLGQVQTMKNAFSGLLFGLAGSIVLIYLLVVVNFQSWTDPFVIITALPAALAGIVWILFATETTLSVPALTGAIMCMGVATANSVLVISFAREKLDELGDPIAAAMEAGFVRFRPVLMTALAMVIGMLPMALGLGEGGEQNAPLGRAVVGGLIFATTATLMFVPVIFSLLHGHRTKPATRTLETRMLPEAKSSTVSRRGLYIAGMVMMTVAATIVITGIMTRKSAHARLIAWTDTRSVPVVSVSYPDTNPGRATLDLPGQLNAYNQAALYARVSGYLKDWYADIGTKVKAGQLLAEIDAPDQDQQYSQAQANLVSARANAKLADATLTRGQQLVPSGFISKQDLDQRAADAANKQGLVQSATADLDRLKVLEQYKRITAPFDGLVTARTTDIGHLIGVGSNGPPLFVVSDISKLRVYVQVPQKYAPSILVGTKATLTVPEYPNRTFSATVVASAQAVNVASGTTRIELIVDNASGELMTGDFTNVSFDLPNPEVAVNVPASALIFDQSGLSVATVDHDDRVVVKKVTISRDLGKTIEIGAGISAKDRVISTPPDGIVSGDLVRVAGGSEATGEKQAALVAQ